MQARRAGVSDAATALLYCPGSSSAAVLAQRHTAVRRPGFY
jgi:hypothetical protein